MKNQHSSYARWAKLILLGVVPIIIFVAITEKLSWRPKQLMWESANFRGDFNLVPCMTFLPDGTLTIISGDSAVRLWNVENRSVMQTFELQNMAVRGSFVNPIGFSPDGQLFAQVSENGTSVNVWQTQSAQLIKTLRTKRYAGLNFDNEARDIAFSSDSNRSYAVGERLRT